MRTLVLDIETESLTPSHIWCICTRDVETGETEQFLNPTSVPEEKERFNASCQTYDRFVLHNGIGFDVPVLRKLLGTDIKDGQVLDTLVVSRLKDYGIAGGHSLKAWGERLRCWKGDFKDFSKLTQKMVDYCHQDVEVTYKLYQKLLPYIKDKTQAEALETEHRLQWLCEQMTDNGFLFREDEAEEILGSVLVKMETLEKGFQTDFPPELKMVHTLMYRTKADGTVWTSVKNAQKKYLINTVVKDGMLRRMECYDYVPFNPSSPQKRIDRLWEAGWKPTSKTKGALAYDREYNKDPVKVAKFSRYGWKCDETNLKTLPDTAPDGAHNLAEWLTLEGRRSSLVEWLGQLKPDGRVHGRFTHIGAWTGRMAHSKPNQANIPAAFHDTPRTAVEKVKAEYDGPMRGLWHVPEGSLLVGTDAEGIQLRILAHLMKSEEYIQAITTGRKEDETDIHNLNRKALGLNHITRDDAKTFIYAFLLGAGNAKVAEILDCSTNMAAQAVDNFTKSISGLHHLKTKLVPAIAKAGWFTGLDGRRVPVPSQHKTLAGMLQNGESVIMKHAALQWTAQADRMRLDYKLVTWPHDEWQTEVKGDLETAEELGAIQRQSIVDTGEKLCIMCPLAGSTDIGLDWNQTH